MADTRGAGNLWNNNRVVPYQFEPPAQEHERNVEENNHFADNNGVYRLGNTDWCECGNCVVMEKVEECNCCTESTKIMEKLNSRRPLKNPGITCITQLPAFQSVCLNTDVLETAYYQYRQEHGTFQATLEEKYRYIGYRQLVRWCHGVLGRKVRIPLPSCAVRAIRNAFPSEDTYRGFEWPELP
ncbi:P2X purinoceptor 7-like [Littorina saxatilis]|uniref:P2X purinoreceptor 7 intracellular domain-containing protein n=1 Tax=Littorina saxatilis TaxID=31220 RepID=A0AAN9B2Z5_9CAEN